MKIFYWKVDAGFDNELSGWRRFYIVVDENCLMKKKLHQILNVHYRLLILVNHSCYGASKLFSSQGKIRKFLISSRWSPFSFRSPLTFLVCLFGFFRCSFVFRGGVNKEPVPVQSLRDLMQEEEQKTNIPSLRPTPRIPIAPAKSGSARKKLKY